MLCVDKIIPIASSFVGSCACQPFRETIFNAVGFPFDPRPFQKVNGKYEGISTCYVFARHVLEIAGAELPAWHLGEPIGTIERWCPAAWTTEGEPEPGDVVLIGHDGGTHVLIVESLIDDILRSIDGGQVCFRTGGGHDGTGRQMIARRERRWLGKTVVGYSEEPVVGWVSVRRMVRG